MCEFSYQLYHLICQHAHFFHIEVMYLLILLLKVLINLAAITDFASLCVE